MSEASDQASGEDVAHEQRLSRFYRYWGYCYGIVAPKWLEDMVGFRAMEVYYHRYRGRHKHLAYIPCAIEIEHRKRPIATLSDLQDALAVVSQPHYDYSAAIALEQEVDRERSALRRASDAAIALSQADLPRRAADALPDGKRLLRELDAKRLPHGAIENLAVIRAIVGIDK